MQEPYRKLPDVLFERRSMPIFHGISGYFKTRRPSDRVILGLLGLLVIVSSIASLLALENHLLVVEPVRGGSLVEGDVGSPRFVNPILAITNTDQDLTTLTYAGLMGEDGSGNLVPVLAQNYTISPDGKTYTFTLRKNLKFSDGTPITANDVVFTVQKAQDSALKSPQYADWSTVTASAVDPQTVEFTLKAPYAPFLQDATLGILPSHLWKNLTDAEFPFSNYIVKPVGSGPFVVSNLTRDSDGDIASYDLTANPNYPLGRPYLDSIHFVFYPDQASLQTAANSHKVESAYGVTGANQLTAHYSRVFAVFFNAGESSVFAQKPVRQALSTAIDRPAIIKNVLGGYGTALMGPVPPNTGVPAIQIPSGDLVASSTGILSSNGWKFSTTTGEWTDKSGNILSVTLKTSDVPELRAIAGAIQSNWKKLGVPTSLQFYEPGDLTQNIIRPRAYQALLFGMVIGKGDDLYDFWDSAEQADPGLNVADYSNKDVDALLEKLRTETDPIKRQQDLATINADIAADYPAAFIESPDFVYVVPKDLKGVILPTITSPSDRFATVSTWYRRTESVWPFFAKSK